MASANNSHATDIFLDLASAIMQTEKAAAANSEEQMFKFKELLSKMNRVDFARAKCDEKFAESLLLHCCDLIQTQDEETVMLFTNLIFKLLTKQKLIVNSAAEKLVDFLLQCLYVSTDDRHYNEVLKGLGAVVYQTGAYLPVAQLQSVMTVVTRDVSQTLYLLRSNVQCIESLCMKTTTGASIPAEYQKQCFGVLVNILQSAPQVYEQTSAKMLRSLLGGLERLILDLNCVETADLTVIMPPLISLMQYGKSHKLVKAQMAGGEAVTRLVPQGSTQEVVQGLEDMSLTPKKPSLYAAAGEPAYPYLSTGSSSGSEMSDSETETSSKKLHGSSIHVRIRALTCLQVIIKVTDRQAMFPYWPLLIPDSQAPEKQTSLFASIINEPLFKVRRAGILTLTALVEGSKQYLIAAEDLEQARAAPFTPYSTTLANMIREIHRCVLKTISLEPYPSVLTKAIKCLTVFIPNVPYQRLKRGLLTQVYGHIKTFVNYRDPDVQVACLSCLGALVSVQAPLLEVCQILTEKDVSHNGDSGVSSENNSPQPQPSDAGQMFFDKVFPPGQPCWVFTLCLRLISPSLAKGPTTPQSKGGASASPRQERERNHPLPVRLECLQLLAALAKHYFALLSGHLPTVTEIVRLCLQENEDTIQLHGAKLLEAVSSTILHTSTQDPEELANVLWQPILSAHVSTRLTAAKSSPSLRTVLCDCIANIGPNVFQHLPRSEQIMAQTLALGLTCDSHFGIQAAAVRLVGVMVMYPVLREDEAFLSDAANAIINAYEDSEPLVKIRVSWSLGNISDVLVCNNEENVKTSLSLGLLLKMFEVSIKAALGADKVRANALRGLGNLLRNISPKDLSPSALEQIPVQKSVEAITKNLVAGPAKIRWNACYALANALKNQALFENIPPWFSKVQTGLLSALGKSNNFKVKIGACLALRSLSSRKFYGDTASFSKTWNTLLAALRAPKETQQLSDVKLSESLTLHVLETLAHLCSLMEKSDLERIALAVESNKDELEAAAAGFNGKLDEQQMAGMRRATDALEKHKSVGSAEKLCEIFNVMTQVTSDLPAPAQTAFKQTYD